MVVVDQHLNIVERTARGVIGQHPPVRMIHAMLRRVPSTLGEVEASNKRHSVIHDHDFLMLGGSDRVSVVLPEMETPSHGQNVLRGKTSCLVAHKGLGPLDCDPAHCEQSC